MQILISESKFVRKGVIELLKKLQAENENLKQQVSKEISRKELALMILQAEEENERLMLENSQIKEKVIELLPEANYTKEVLQSDGTITTTTIAKELKMKSAQVLNELLVKLKIQYFIDGHYVLTAKYSNRGYVDYETNLFTNKDGKSFTTMTMKWTEKGRKFLHDMFNNKLKNTNEDGFNFSLTHQC